MKKFSIFMAALFGFSAMVMADNLVQNGEFEKLDKKGRPVGWTASVSKGGTIKAAAVGAPDGGSITFTLPENGKFDLRQLMTNVLKPNTRYEVSFKVRGKDFKSANLAMIFINEGWTKSSGIRKIAVTDQWKEYKSVVKTPDFKKLVSLIFYSTKATGTIEICDVEVELPDND